MKTIFKSFVILFLSSLTFVSCSNDDDDTDYPESIDGTTWYRQETQTQSGQTYDIDVDMVFENSNNGYLETSTVAAGTNIVQTYVFTYTYSSGSGTASFSDQNIGIQDFTINGNKLRFDGKDLTRQ